MCILTAPVGAYGADIEREFKTCIATHKHKQVQENFDCIMQTATQNGKRFSISGHYLKSKRALTGAITAHVSENDIGMLQSVGHLRHKKMSTGDILYEFTGEAQ